MKTIHVFSQLSGTPDTVQNVLHYSTVGDCLVLRLDKDGILFYPLLHVHCFGEMPQDGGGGNDGEILPMVGG